MARLRIGAVSFLNTRPLVHGLQVGHTDYALSFDTPSNLAEKLRLDEIDVGLLPIVEHLRGVGDSWVPGIGIASDGPVRTVKLYSRVPFESLRDVAVDGRSRTSVAMLRILLAEKFGVVPDFYSHRPDLPAMLRAHAAALLIGDTAFQDGGAPHVWDLGQAWKELTGLPFVYAVWTVREGVDRAKVADLLRVSLSSGLGHLDEIAAGAAGTQGLDAAAVLTYLRDSLHYVLGERDAQGLEAFHKLCLRYNLVPAGSRTTVAAHP
jgi:chorismate dehydratase